MVRALRSWWHESERWYFVVGLANLGLGTSSVLVPFSVDKVFDRSVAGIGWIIAGIGSGQVAARFGYSTTFGIASVLLVLNLLILLSVPYPAETSQPLAAPSRSVAKSF